MFACELRKDCGADAASRIELFERACGEKSPRACAQLGDMYEFQYGQGIERDSKRAVLYYEKGCQLGSSNACYALGVMLRSGTGTGRDTARAAQLFERACNDNLGAGCAALAQLHEAKELANADPARAQELRDQAFRMDEDSCHNGDPGNGNYAACCRAGKSYEQGQGVPADRKKAVERYQAGCAERMETCCDALRNLAEPVPAFK